MIRLLRCFSSKEEDLGKNNQDGFSLIEVLVAILLVGIIAASINSSITNSLQLSKRTQIAQIMQNLAIAQIEQLAGVDAITLDNGDDTTESAVTAHNTTITFTRVTDITVNADASRTVVVTVSSNGNIVPAPVSHTATFALWE